MTNCKNCRTFKDGTITHNVCGFMTEMEQFDKLCKICGSLRDGIMTQMCVDP